MELDVLPAIITPRKRKGPEEIDFEEHLKRNKYNDFFKGHFGSIDEVNIKTLEIQNRELFLQLQVRTNEVDDLNQQLNNLKKREDIYKKKTVSMAIFLDEFVHHLYQLSGKSLDASEPISFNDPSSLFIKKLFFPDDANSNEFQESSSLACAEIVEARQNICALFTSIFPTIQTEQAMHEKLIFLSNDSNTSEELKSQVKILSQRNQDLVDAEISHHRTILSLKGQLSNKEIEKQNIYDNYTEFRHKYYNQQRMIGRLDLKIAKLEKIKLESIVSNPLTSSPSAASDPTDSNMDLNLSSNVLKLYPKQLDHASGLNPPNDSQLISDHESDDWKLLAQLRLTEVETLRAEKMALFNKVNEIASSPSFSTSNSYITNTNHEGHADCQHLIDHHQLLLSGNQAQQKRITDLLDELLHVKTIHRANLESVSKECKSQAQEIQHNLDRMTEKLKRMEQDRDQAKFKYQQLKISVDSLKEDLARSESKTKEILGLKEKYKSDYETLKLKLKESESHIGSDPGRKINELESKIVILQAKIELLNKNLGEDVVNQVDLEARLMALDAENNTLANLAGERKKEIDSLSAAIDTYYTAELQSSNEMIERLQTRIKQKEAKIDNYRSELLCLRTASGQKKKQSSMILEEQGALTSKIAHLRSLLQEEVDHNKSLVDEIEHLSKESLKLRQSNEKLQNVVTQCAITASLCEKKIQDMDTGLRAAKEELANVQIQLEEEKNRHSRVLEELEVSKRRLNVLKASNDAKPANEIIRSKGDSLLAFYQRTYNCTLCSRSRAADSILITCFHAFCALCIEEKCLKPRNRKCPACNKKFDKVDVHKIFYI